MHPFALNDEALEQVSGGVGGGVGGGIVDDPTTPIGPIEETTLRLGEEGGWTPDPT